MYQGSELELSNIYHLNESKDGVIFKLKKIRELLGSGNGFEKQVWMSFLRFLMS